MLVDKLVKIADKEDRAECARLLAMNVAYYEMRYGALPFEEQLAVTSKLNADHAELVARGMKTMAGVSGNVTQGLDEKIEHQV